MARQSLYEIVSNTVKDGKGKSSIGYSLFNSYEGTLKDLESSPSFNSRFGEVGQSANRDAQGFIINSDDSLSYQAQCEIKDYMSYFVDIFDNNSNTTKNCFVTVNKHKNYHINNGLTLQNSSEPTFPMATLLNDDIKKLSSGLGGDDKPCKIGVGISINYFGLQFFNKFFGDLKWTSSAIRELASKGYLYAEVLFPRGGGQAWSWHAKVTVDDGGLQGSSFSLLMPIPILLLNNFNSLCKVVLTDVNGKQQIVGQGTTIFPLAGSNYNPKTASIEGLTPSFLKTYVSTGQVTTRHKHTSLATQGTNKSLRARVRLYFDQEAKSDIQTKVGAIPQNYQRNLFRGHGTFDSIVNYNEIVNSNVNITFTGGNTDSCRYAPNQVDWEWIKTSSWKLYYQYKDDIEKACRDNDLNVRLLLAHSAYETGYLRKSTGWTAGLFNTGGILWKTPNTIVNGSKYGLPNVTLKSSDIPNLGNDGKGGKSIHGYFIDFQNAYNGFFAHCYLVATSSNYGFKTFNLQTVSQYANALQNGVNGKAPYCANCPEYAKTIQLMYERIKGVN